MGGFCGDTSICLLSHYRVIFDLRLLFGCIDSIYSLKDLNLPLTPCRLQLFVEVKHTVISGKQTHPQKGVTFWVEMR